MKSDNLHWPSVLQFGLSLFACLLCWAMAAFFVLSGISQFITTRELGTDTVSFFLLAAGAVFSGILLLPSAGYALLRLLGRPFPSTGRLGRILRPSFLILFFPLVLFLGYVVSQFPTLAWFALPLLHVLAVGLPILWLAYLGWRGLPTGSPQRNWGIFGSGLVLGPGVIMILEFFSLGVILFLGIIYIAFHPSLLQELNNLSERLRTIPITPDETMRLFQPYLTWPGAVFVIFAFVAVLVPLIEEAIKPIGAWFLVGKNLAPAEGFVAGLLSGAGYALFENLALTTVNTENWIGVVFLRIGTGMLHIMTAALVGWALGLAWIQGRYLRLGMTYLVAVLIHGLWNGLALLSAANDLSIAGQAVEGLAGQVDRLAFVGLAFLAVAMFLVYIGSNALLRRADHKGMRSDDGVNFPTD